MLRKTWFGFDLDDTLHEFRLASSKACEAVFNLILQKYSNDNLNFETLKTAYSQILKKGTANAFIENKTSTEYRTERFTALLHSQSLTATTDFLDELTRAYQLSLKEALQLKPGAKELLQHLRSKGKKIIIITEGPRDAQEWTVRNLGLDEYVDVLVTSSEMGKSKVDGLFGKVLTQYGIEAEEIVFVGDNLERDVLAGRDAGMCSVLFDEGWDGVTREDGIVCVRDLREILKGWSQSP
jgi:putative hydrolase of the HAD superfamily